MPRRRTSRVHQLKPERRLHLKVSSPRIVCFECLRALRRSGKLALVLGLLASVVIGAKAGMESFFIENEEFGLSEISLETNGCLTEGHFAELTGLDPTGSIFTLKLRDLREKLLARPGIVKAELSRRLPGTLRVKVEERLPIAWLECRPLGIVGKDPATGLLLDENGVCFPCEPWWEEEAQPLPVLLVSQVEDGDVTIGKQLRHHQARRGLELIKKSREFLGEADWSLPVVAVCNEYSLAAATSRGVHATFGLYGHERQLGDLITLVQTMEEAGESMAAVNLIPERNIPVRVSWPGGEGLQPEDRVRRDMRAILGR